MAWCVFRVFTIFWLGRYTRNSTSIQLSCLLLCSIIVILGVTSFACLFKYLEIYIEKINYFQFIPQVLSNFRKLLWMCRWTFWVYHITLIKKLSCKLWFQKACFVWWHEYLFFFITDFYTTYLKISKSSLLLTYAKILTYIYFAN